MKTGKAMAVATGTYLLSIFLLREPLTTIGSALGLSGWMAYTLPGLLIWASIYRLALDEWGWPDALAILILGGLGMIYLGGGLQVVAYELVKTLTGFGALSVITLKLAKNKGGSSA
jgi:hypothetical protein